MGKERNSGLLERRFEREFVGKGKELLFGRIYQLARNRQLVIVRKGVENGKVLRIGRLGDALVNVDAGFSVLVRLETVAALAVKVFALVRVTVSAHAAWSVSGLNK